MNWPLVLGLALAFGVIIGNIMLIKHSAKMKIPSLKDLNQLSEPFPEETTAAIKKRQAATSAEESTPKSHSDQKTNNLE